ncbi:MAG TPA: HPr family phosphocarrier protein [Solirubrobacteraceae bacterium]|nr:HPr family phosphocarrier protein [Solirubrobacteraceae bacterium]
MQTSSEHQAVDAEISLPADVDLHARPAATFVKASMAFQAKISVGTADREADAKSLLSVLALGARRGTTLRLRAEGDDAASAIDTLAMVVAALRE